MRRGFNHGGRRVHGGGRSFQPRRPDGATKDWVNVGDIDELTPRIAKAYPNKTPKTVQRDLNVLAGMKLIDREPRRVRARRELIAFLPLRKIQPSAEKRNQKHLTT
jgi:hypothetical protein